MLAAVDHVAVAVPSMWVFFINSVYALYSWTGKIQKHIPSSGIAFTGVSWKVGPVYFCICICNVLLLRLVLWIRFGTDNLDTSYSRRWQHVYMQAAGFYLFRDVCLAGRSWFAWTRGQGRGGEAQQLLVWLYCSLAPHEFWKFSVTLPETSEIRVPCRK